MDVSYGICEEVDFETLHLVGLDIVCTKVYTHELDILRTQLGVDICIYELHFVFEFLICHFS